MRILGLAALSGASVGFSSPLYAQVGRVEANGVVLTYESHGPADKETILLIAGTNMQLTSWPRELCQKLVKRGYRVITYDNRDVGLSTRFDSAGAPDFAAVVQAAQAGTPAPLPYTLYDMAKDAVALLDALAIRKAHIAGVSMGGMIAQIVATNHAERTLSLTSIMATDGKPGLPFVGKPDVIAKVPPPAPDGDRKAYIERAVKVWQVIGSPGYPSDEETLLETITRDVDRAYCPACEARQAAAALFTSLEDRRARLRSIRIPTVVIHGAEDPLVPLEAGRDTAASIPGAELRVIPGMGHDLPRALIGAIAEGITAAASRARAGAAGK
jgi:pimeloyl-ACP methyl ester carboxylesterase